MRKIKNLFNRIWSITWGLLLLTVLCVPASAVDSGSCGENLKWSLESGVLTITGSGNMTDYADGDLPPWYDRRGEITEVSLPDGLTSIGALAFFDCANLTGAVIPDSVTSVSDYAFAQCVGLLTVSLPEGLTDIGDGAFRECEGLLALRIPGTVTRLGDQAFYRCVALRSVTVSNSVTDMGSQVFSYCTGLAQAVVRANVTQLPAWSFYGCTMLNSLTLGTAINNLGPDAVTGCDNLHGIYTETLDQEVANQIQQDMGETPGYAAAIQPPASTVVNVSDGSSVSSIKVTETEDSLITVEEELVYSGTAMKSDSTVSAVIEGENGWTELVQTVSGLLDSEKNGTIEVNVQLTGSEVSGKSMAALAGKNVAVNLTTSDGSQWHINMADTSLEDFSGTYALGTAVEYIEGGRADISCEALFRLTFSGATDFNTTVAAEIGEEYALQYATLYQMKGGAPEPVQSVLVDQWGDVWLNLASADNRTEYYLAVNAQGQEPGDAVIPSTMQYAYGAEGQQLSLMDENGVYYAVTGRSSRWGISGGTFALYVALAMVLMIAIVAIVMFGLNKLKLAKQKDWSKDNPS